MKSEVSQHLERAEELLEVANELVALTRPADSASRSYYAMFHAVKAVLIELGIKRKSHHAVWSAFGEFVTAPGLMDKKFHRSGLQLFVSRSQSDYLAIPENTIEEAKDDLVMAMEFVVGCREFIEKKES